MKKIRLILIAILSLILCSSVFVLAYAQDSGDTSTTNGVIEAETTYVDIANASSATWWGHGSVSTTLKPAQGKGATDVPSAAAAKLAYWTPGANATPAHDVATSLGVTYSVENKTSNLGVAVWLYIGNQETLNDMSTATFKVDMGNDKNNYWITGASNAADYDLVVGWNELVFKQNIGWASGSPDMANGIGYVKFTFEKMGTTVTHDIAINDFRLVRTNQTTNMVLNRTEKFIGVIQAEKSFGEPGATGITNGAGGSVVSGLTPTTNTAKSIKYTIAAGGNHYWSPYLKADTAVAVVDELGISYTTSTSNLGVALWFYIADQTTLNSLTSSKISFFIGDSSTAYYISCSQTAMPVDELVVGWNELVFKHNIAWSAGADKANLDIEKGFAYVNLKIESMSTDVSRTLAINDVRLVKTAQTTSVVVNRTEKLSCDCCDETCTGDCICIKGADCNPDCTCGNANCNKGTAPKCDCCDEYNENCICVKGEDCNPDCPCGSANCKPAPKCDCCDEYNENCICVKGEDCNPDCPCDNANCEVEQEFTAIGVIANAVTFGEIGTTGITNGAGGNVVSDLYPSVNTANSIKNTLAVGGNHYWSPYLKADTSVQMVKKLGITYSANSSDLGVAVWLYISDKATLDSLANAKISFHIGDSATAYYISCNQTAMSDYEFVVGWNELVFKHNIAWSAGADKANLNIENGFAYVCMKIESMSTDVSRILAINDVRFVRTTQTSSIVVNRTEKAPCDCCGDACEDCICVKGAGCEKDCPCDNANCEVEQEFTAIGVIANAVTFGEIGTTGITNGAGGNVVSDLYPSVNTANSIKNTLGVGGNHYWSPYLKADTAVQMVKKLGITYSANSSDLGVAVWLYISDKTTLDSLANAKISFFIGDSSTAYYISCSQTAMSDYELVVGWNELVFKHDIAWSTGADKANLNIENGFAYVCLKMEDMSTDVSRTLAINDVRFVRTTQTSSIVVNRTEKAPCDCCGDACEDCICVKGAGCEKDCPCDNANCIPAPTCDCCDEYNENCICEKGADCDEDCPCENENCYPKFIGVAGTGVITYEHSFVEFDVNNYASWGATSISSKAPTASNGNTIYKYDISSQWWNSSGTIITPFNPIGTLGVTKGATSDLGVAFWLYIADSKTLDAIKPGVIGVRIGSDENNKFICAGQGSEAGRLTKFDLKVGWNEIVVKVNVGWKTGTPTLDNIAYLQINMAEFGATGASLGINNVRLVKTTQNTDVVVNAFEEAPAEDESSSIVKEKELCQINNDTYSSYGGDYADISIISPFASNGNTITYFNNPDKWWGITVNLTTSIKPIQDLGVLYDDSNKLSDLGVAFWLYIADEETLDAMQTGYIGMKIGPSASKYWITAIGSSAGKCDRLDLKVGWNEIVIKQNAGWMSGSPGALDEISYVYITISDMANKDTHLAINNIRLVKTTQGSDVKVNAFESIGYDSENAIEILQANNENLTLYYPENSTLSDDVPEGFEGKSVVLPATSFVDKTFENPYDATNGATWLDDEDAVLVFWLKITGITDFKYAMEYASEYDDAFVAFTDSNGVAIYASLKEGYSYLNEGWNKIMIKLADTGFDATKINQITLSNDMNIELSMSLYGIALAKANYVEEGCMINDATFGNGYWNKLNNIIISEPENIDGWENVEKVDVVGTGLVQKDAAIASQNVAYIAYTESNIDISEWNSQFLTVKFWLYISDVDAFEGVDNFVYIAESADSFANGNYFKFDLKQLKITKGWNEVRVRLLSEALTGTVDVLQIKYFRFEVPVNNYTMAISGINVYESSVKDVISLVGRAVDVSEEAPNPEHKVVFDNTSSIDKWDQHAFGVMPYSPDENGKSIYLTSSEGVIQTRLRTTPVDISNFNFNHTVLTFWLYVNDINLMGELDGSIELGTGMLEDDSNEFWWEFRSVSLRGFESNKWHKIALRIIPSGLKHSNETGTVDLSSLRFFRMYWIGSNVGKDVQVLISNVTIEEMDTSSFYEKVTVVEKRDFVEGSTPGSIDVYDMIESSDGTFPQERPGSSNENKNGCGSVALVDKFTLFVSFIVLSVTASLLLRKKLRKSK